MDLYLYSPAVASVFFALCGFIIWLRFVSAGLFGLGIWTIVLPSLIDLPRHSWRCRIGGRFWRMIRHVSIYSSQDLLSISISSSYVMITLHSFKVDYWSKSSLLYCCSYGLNRGEAGSLWGGMKGKFIFHQHTSTPPIQTDTQGVICIHGKSVVHLHGKQGLCRLHGPI